MTGSLRAIVTGTRGLGFETALALAKAGHEVILAGRNRAQGEEAVVAIQNKAGTSKIGFEELDLASLASIWAFATNMVSAETPIDILVNNAGVMSPPARTLTADGFELQLGVNHLGHFALTSALLPLLRKAPAPRVVNVTSLAMRFARSDCFDDVNSESSYNPGLAYCRSKLFQAIFTRGLQQRSDADGWNITSLAAHPGFASTNLIENGPGGIQHWFSKFLIGPMFGQSAAAGAQPAIHAATSHNIEGGALYGPDGWFEMKGVPVRRDYAKLAIDPGSAERVWRLSELMTGRTFT